MKAALTVALLLSIGIAQAQTRRDSARAAFKEISRIAMQRTDSLFAKEIRALTTVDTAFIASVFGKLWEDYRELAWMEIEQRWTEENFDWKAHQPNFHGFMEYLKRRKR